MATRPFLISNSYEFIEANFVKDDEIATVATTGAYSDLTGTPDLATVATTGAYADLTGTPSLATVATTGAYSDLSGTPVLGDAAALDVGTGAGQVAAGDHTHSNATVSTAGFLSATDKTKLDGIESGAQVNDVTSVVGQTGAVSSAQIESAIGISSFAKTFLDDTSSAAVRATLGGTAFQALGTLTAANNSFVRFTGTGSTSAAMQAIVGTVSGTSGGGAIVEFGSNANGNYTLLADGRMLQRSAELTLTFSSASRLAVTWTFPASFSTATFSLGFTLTSLGNLTGTKQDGALSLIGNMTTSSVLISLISNSKWASGDTCTIRAFAISEG